MTRTGQKFRKPLLQRWMFRNPLPRRRTGWILAWLFLVLSAAVPAGAAGLVISSDMQFDYADTLFSQKDFRNAEVEFKRCIHFFPQDPRAGRAAFLTGMALFHQEMFYEAARQFDQIIRNDSDIKAIDTCEAYFMQSRAFLEMNNPGYARVVLENFLLLTQDPAVRDRIYLHLARLHIQVSRQPGVDELDQAGAALENISPGSDLVSEKTDLMDRIRSARSVPEKKPVMAGLLAVIPGGGFAYTGRFHDAAAAFCLNTALGLGAWKAFDQGNPALGAVAAVVGAGFYSGSIYGSISGAHKHNHALKIQALDQGPALRTGIVFNPDGVFFSFNQRF